MKKILITGALGQIGSELTMKLIETYGSRNIVTSSHCKRNECKKKIIDESPYVKVDILKAEDIANAVSRHKIDTIIHLASILSAKGEENPHRLWDINMNGLYNILEVAREKGCRVFVPSSIAAFGPSTPMDNTPQDTIQRPSTIYGISKVSGELLCDYYFKRYGVDTRGLRFPGLISHVTLPGGGTTDYAVHIFYEALKKGQFTCNIKAGTKMDMMYMPDALNAIVNLMEADPDRLTHRNAFNVTAMSFEPQEIYMEIKRHIPDFTIDYEVDEMKQRIAESWPNSIDDTVARIEWDWKPEYDLTSMTNDMIDKLGKKLNVEKNPIII